MWLEGNKLLRIEQMKHELKRPADTDKWYLSYLSQ